jgi:hypothetical protein
MALYVVVLIVMLLSLAGYSFLALTATEYEAVQIRGVEIQAQQLTESGTAWLESVLTLPETERGKIGGLYDNRRQFCAVPLQRETQNDTLILPDTGRFTVLSPRIENSGIIGVRYGLTNESAKLHLLKLLEWESQDPDAAKHALEQLPGMTEVMADSILDWIDADRVTRANGAEQTEYQRLNKPYAPRNAVPVSLEEFLLVRAVTRKNLFAGDENFNFVPDELEAGHSQNQTFPLPWTHFLTVFSAERDAGPEGFARIDLNQPNLEFLHQLLEQRVSRAAADFVVLLRQYGPVTEPAAVTDNDRGRRNDDSIPTASRRRSRPPEILMDYTIPGSHSLTTPLDVLDVSVSVPGRETPLPSPFMTADPRQQTSLPLMLRFLDQTTTSPVTTIIGRVNINEAPREVLLAIPGMTPPMVQRILTRRPRPGTVNAAFRHPSWLLTERIVDLPTLKTLWPNLTCGGDVYSAQVIGFFDETGTFSRRKVTVDATMIPPRVVDTKELTGYGIGFANTVLFGNTAVTPPENSMDSIMDAMQQE